MSNENPKIVTWTFKCWEVRTTLTGNESTIVKQFDNLKKATDFAALGSGKTIAEIKITRICEWR